MLVCDKIKSTSIHFGLQAAAEDRAAGTKTRSLPYAILLAAALSVESPFLHTSQPPEGDTPGDKGSRRPRDHLDNLCCCFGGRVCL